MVELVGIFASYMGERDPAEEDGDNEGESKVQRKDRK
jgi:hypothetical protein